ncbi:MAG: GNAT family N-acetyltransferase [Anaerolineae bacterium]|nr:GNAT family N-acetyltransferase [Anaerolineae bacterium]
MAAVLTHSKREYFGLRAMDPMKDLRGVADLIEKAFASELDRSGQSALRELRWLSRLKPLLWWMVYANADHSDFLSGFVWEEDNQIVGNITVNRTSPGSRRWLISNVAVAEAYQGRGIARTLMLAGIELAREYNALSVSLQVRADNAPARHLYETLNFQEISGTTHLHLGHISQTATVQPMPRLPTGIMLRQRNFSSADARRAYNLATAAMPLNVQKEWPLRQNNFRLSSQARISGFFRGVVGSGPPAYWIMEDGQRFVSLIDIQPGLFGQPHRIYLVVHPDWRGVLERSLISRALIYLSPWRKSKVLVKHPSDHIEAIETFKEFGFRESQTLLWLKKEM